MSRADVDAAIERWHEQGLISAELAARLRDEHSEATRDNRRQFSQYAIAGTAGFLLVLAGGTFLAWTWPSLGPRIRTLVIGALGLGVQGLGFYLEGTGRNRPVSYALQTTGLALLLGAYAYSEESWPDATAAGLVVGVLSLATPLALAPIFIRRNSVMPAVATAMGYGFLFLFLDRAVGLDDDAIIWTLDAVMLASVVALALKLRGAGNGEEVHWQLNAFVASLYVGFILILLTAFSALDLDEQAVLALDFWLTLITGLALWGIHRAPQALRREWYGTQLAVSMLFAIGLGFWTTLGLFDATPPVAAAVVGGLGAAGLRYGLRMDMRRLTLSSCLAIVVAAWYFGIEQGRVLGGALALGFTAALLFWVSARLGREESQTAHDGHP